MSLDSIPLSEREMFALLVARKAVEQYRGTPFEQPLADMERVNLFCRLVAG